MQQGKKEKPKVRFTRNDDGSIGVPRDKEATLLDAWQPKENSAHKDTVKKVHKTPTNYTKVVKNLRSSGAMYAMQVKDVALSHKKMTIIIATVVLVSGIVLALLVNNSTENTTNDVTNKSSPSQIETNVTPSFPVLTPLGNGADKLGGFAKISPEGAPNVYAFTDVIGASPIRVSQQQLPDNLRTDQATKIKELAEGFNAKEALEVGDNIAYIGTSVNGAQSIVYVKGENLVLIGSDTIIPNSEWVTYIGNLRY